MIFGQKSVTAKPCVISCAIQLESLLFGIAYSSVLFGKQKKKEREKEKSETMRLDKGERLH